MIRRNASSPDPTPAPTLGSPLTVSPQKAPDPFPPTNAGDVDSASNHVKRASLLRRAMRSKDAPITHLDSKPPTLDFPTDYSRSSTPLKTRAWRARVLSPTLLGRIHSFCAHSSATPHDWLLCAWASLIYRYTSSDDFAIGRLPVLDSSCGTSDATCASRSAIALRFQLKESATNLAVKSLAESLSMLTRSSDDAHDALLEPDVPTSPLPIQAGFVDPFRNEQGVSTESHSLDDFVAQSWHPQTELQISFGMADGTVRIDFLTALWLPETIDRMLSHFETLLRSFLDAPDASICQHRLLTDAEWQQIVVQWNANTHPFLLDRSVHGMIVEQSNRTPDAIAVVCEDQSLTYRELDEKSDRLARHLHALGVVPGALVGLSIEQSTHVLIAILGILKAGAAYVPLDIKHPADRLQSIVQDAGLEVVVTSTQLAPRLPIATDQMVLLDAMLQSSGNHPASERFHADVTAAHLAYVLYTSGTTGKPKGVAISHRAVVNFLCAMTIRPGMKPGERLLSITSPSFDISVMEMLLPLVVGATVEVVPAQHIKDPAALAEALQRSRAQMMQATPTTWQMMVLHGWNGHPNLKLITGGETLSDALAAQLMQRCDELWNQYGPTEATVYATQYLVPPGGPNRNVGKPIANCQVYILDPHGNPVPVGVPGEIYLGGEPLARGYLHRDDLTAEKFTCNPFTDDPKARIYQTGDLGRWTADGEIQCLGRIDHQVKLRGYRIELKEIESWLNQWPGIRESVVRLREDIPGDPRLVAYCVFPEATRPNATEVVAYLHQKLPSYMVPSDLVWLECLPVTVNGKVDVKALPKPDRGSRERQEVCVAPRTPLESLIAEVFQSILGVPQIGINDSFFALGGHSLSAVRAIVRIRDHSAYPIRVRMLFEHPTPEQLASYLSNTYGPYPPPAPSDAVPVIQHASIVDPAVAKHPSGVAPLSFAQMRLWLVDEIENGTNAYNIPRAYQLRGPLDTVALARAIERLIERHEPLRTTFRVVDGSPVQCVRPTPKLDLEIESLEDVPTDRMRETIQLRFEQIADERSHLAEDIPFRARLLRLSPQNHVLITNTHHIASDEWSVDVFNAELSTAYRDALHGQPCSLPSLPTRYIDYAVQQRSELSGNHYASMLEYWKSQLQGMPTLDVPHDFPRPYRPTYACGQHRLQFDPELVARLHSIARESQCTLHMVFLAAFQCLLQKWSKQDDICVGMPIAGRMHEDLEPLIGFFVNTLVIRGDLSGNPTFYELLQRVRATSLAAYDHQEMPFEKLVEELQPERTFNSNPLVQVLFQLTNFKPSALNLEGLTAQQLDLDEPRLRFDLEVYVTQNDDSLTGSIHFARELFEPETIARFAQQFLTLLDSIAAAPEKPISDLDWVSQRDAQRVLIEWNDTHAETPGFANITQWIDAQTEQSPDAIAVEFSGEQLSYRQLKLRSQSIARAIANACATTPRRVGIMMDRSIDLIAGILGILRAGAAVVPIDPAYPELRRHFILSDAKIDLLLTNAGMPQSQMEGSAPVLHTDALTELDRKAATIEFQFQITTPTDPVYILYTSGSTGQPKGVEMPHRAMLNLVQWHRSVPRLQRPARTLQFATCNFDVSFQEILTTLCTGGTLVLVSEDIRRDPDELWRYLASHSVQRIFLPFVMLQQLATACNESAREVDTPSLQDIVSAGEALLFTPELQHLLARLPDCRLHNHYGPTETHVITSHLVSDHELRSLRESPIGKPISNSQVYVLDAQRRPLPPGIPGDVWLAGDCLAHGYVDRPELTDSRFMEVTLPLVGSKRMYQSGDLARWNNRGELLYLGRSDDQVKHRGVRIELGEIEARLLEHSAVAQAAVAIQSAPDGLQRLCAYYVLREGATTTHGDLQAFLRQRLPDAMVPNAWATMDSLPLTASGKLNRRALPKEVHWQTDTVDHVEPNTHIEVVVAEIWASLFGIDRVSAVDHFFSLGGHSLLAARMRSRLERELGCHVPLRRIFEFPILREFAETLSAQIPDANATQAALLPLSAVPGTLDQLNDDSLQGPLSFAQTRLWLIDQLESGTSAYNVPNAYRIRGPLQQTVLESAVESVIQRHEPLRTHVLVQSGAPIQRVSSEKHGPIQVDLIPDRDPAALDRLIQEWFTREADRPFALSEELPIRFKLLRIDSNDHVLLVNIHHIAVDGWSFDVFHHDLATAFRDALAFQLCSLQPLPMRYLDYANRQHQLLAGDRYQTLLAYWKQQLEDLPLLELPHDRPRPQRPSFACGQERMQFDPELVARLHSIARESQCTLHMVFLAAFQCLLQKWSKQDDICVGMPIAGRMHEDLEPLIGFFVNTLVIREDLSGNPTFQQLLQRVRATSLAAYDHQEMPFEKLVEELQPDRSFNSNPLVQVLFQLLHFSPSDLKLDGLDVQPLDLDEPRVRFDLEVHLIEDDNSLTGSIHFARELFEPETIARFAQQFLTLLDSIAAAPEKPISDLDWISQRDAQRVLIEWNDTHAETPGFANITQWIDAQTEQSPDAIAVEFSGEQLSYRQLKLRSQSIARAIANACATTPRRVGIMMDRSIDLIAGILGILRAGAAVVPIDPAYPELRRHFILSDAKIDLLLTQSRMYQSRVEGSVPLLHTDTLTERNRNSANADLQPEITSPSDPLYILYTSGSTGQPKGVEMPHRAMLNLVQWHRSIPRLQRPARTLQFATCNFDVSFQEILTTLCTGGTLVLVSEDIRRDPDELWRYLASNHIQRIFVPFVMLQQLATACNDSAREVDNPSLQDIVSAGEALLFTPELQTLLARLPDCRLHNHYGPTETHVITSHLVSDHELRSLRESPIGKPISNSQVYVLDAQRRPLPPGIPGDLWLAGDCLAHGYVDRPELTDSRFMEVTLPLVGSKRMYQSGDLARWNNRGELLYLGRSDDQVKHRGVRIELGEIEARLLEHPAVAQAAVAIQSAPDGLQRLCAYYVLREEGTTTHGDLQAFLRQRLPDAMVPNAWASMDSLPLTASGKLNRRALPTAIAWQGDAMEYVPPITPTESALAALWMELLGAERIGASDNFFALGGHSLLAARMRSCLMQRMGCNIPLRRIFEFPILRDLANSLDANSSESANHVPKLQIPRTGATRGPLSCSQARLWFLESLSGGASNTYNLNYAFKLLGTLDPTSLRNCFEELIARHQILRTRYGQVDGEIYQEVLDTVPIDWYEENLVNVSLEDALRRSESIVSARSQDVFDLVRGEVVRATLVKCAPEVHVFSITIHHIAFDGGSIGIFLTELSESYHRRQHGQSMPSVDASMQYLDYAIWQRSQLSAPSIQESLEYWKTALDGLQPLELPQDTSRPDEASNRGDSVPLHFNRDLVAALKQIGRSCNATLQMTLMASFQMLLGRIARTDDIAIGTATANRNLLQIEQLVGFTANTVLVRTQLDWNTTFRDLLQQVQRTSLDVYAHEDLPFDFLVEHLHPERSANRLPLVQALLQVLPSQLHALRLFGMEVSEFPIGVTSSRFELEAHLWEHHEELDGFLVYSTDLFGRARMQALADRWSSLVHQIAQSPDRKLGEFDVLLPGERSPLLLECNQTQRDLPNGSVADIFQDVAERYGEKVAMIAGEDSWSYASLNRASDRWAEELRQRGVRSGDAVAMLLPRSPKMIVAMLAILKAGGCYVPLSTDDPAPRLATLLQRSRAVIVLTDEELSFPLPQVEIPVLAMHSWEPQAISASGNENGPASLRCQTGPKPEDLAYVLFTSGSTGEPKGVCVEHRSILRLVFGNDYAKLGPDRVFLQLAPAAFDAATFEVWGALLHGATLVLAPPARALDLATIGGLIQHHRVTTLWLTATLFNQWVEEAPESLRGVEEILTGGEALSVPHIHMAQQRLGPHVQLINGYGPTECTTFATCYRIPFPLEECVRSIPIGRPIGNTMAWVVDERFQLVPPGTVGELLLGGMGLARGYLANATMTQSRFIPAPWPEFSGERTYRTGDLVRWNPEGNLEFIGRTDEQVKLRGFRIELGEIESHLMSHPEVQRCVVLITEDAHHQTTLAAYIVASNPATFTPNNVREHLRERLPSYMVPSAFVCIDHIPIKENGKVDTKRLPPIDPHAVIDAIAAIPPRNETERQMLDLWMDVLGKTGFGVMDDFFDLGGHSLLAVKLFAKIEKHFGVKIPLAFMFQHATVAQLVSQLSKASNTEKWVELVPLSATVSDHPLYLLPSLGGELLHLRPLVDAIGNNVPMVGLQPILSDEYVSLSRDLRATAATYVDAIQSHQPQGPYRLGGFSYGGMLAFEVARQLSHAGHSVDYLAIIDTGPCWDGPSMRLRDQLAWAVAVIRNLPGWLACEWQHTPWSVIVSSVKRKTRFAFRWLSSLGKASTTYDDIFESPRIASRDASIMRACFEAFARYTSDRSNVSVSNEDAYTGPLKVFRTRTQSLLSGAQADLGWSRWVESVSVHVLPGNHEMVFSNPSLTAMAREIERDMKRLNEPGEHSRPS